MATGQVRDVVGRRPDGTPAARAAALVGAYDGRPPTLRRWPSDEEAAKQQRERVVRAVIDVSSIGGYAAVSLKEIQRVADVSRRTFFGLFPDQQCAFVACYREIAEAFTRAWHDASADASTPAERVRRSLEAIVAFLVADPCRADVLLIEVHAAGGEVLELRRWWMGELATALAKDLSAKEPIVAELLVGGVHAVLFARVLRAELDDPEALVDDLVRDIVGPHLAADGRSDDQGSASIAA